MLALLYYNEKLPYLSALPSPIQVVTHDSSHRLIGLVSVNYCWINWSKLRGLKQSQCIISYESVDWLGCFFVGLSWTHSCGFFQLIEGLGIGLGWDSWGFLSRMLDRVVFYMVVGLQEDEMGSYKAFWPGLESHMMLLLPHSIDRIKSESEEQPRFKDSTS